VTHLGQRLSALIDGELDGSERERVLLHMARCRSCRDEVAALRMLKRRMNALGEAAAGAGLTGRLIGLSALANLDRQDRAGAGTGWPEHPGSQLSAGTGWPEQHASALTPDRPDRGQRSDQRAGRYFLTGSLVIFLAGLGTAAVIAGGEPQPQAPTPPVTPSVDVLVFPHEAGNGAGTGGPDVAGPPIVRPRPHTAPAALPPGR
jgi:anti-sigma factor RsiW